MDRAYLNCANCNEANEECRACDNGFLRKGECVDICPKGEYGVVEYKNSKYAQRN